ncbi:MAG: MarR family transcriptional regulator [Gemmatimonadaceae bacterium]|jgi:MarR family 2-MHQ and catechol resistance regulon transcriptional repressor|nr:MarR family transcriptional regulator [Gemmatimonadaceae bacterium]
MTSKSDLASDKSTGKAKAKDKQQRKRRRALEAYARLQRAAAVSAAAADTALTPFGLSASQYGVLDALVARGPLHQQELARTAGRSKAQMTAIIDALEARGAVVRERHPTDRRFTSVHLTDAGRALIDEVEPARTDAIVSLMGALSGDQRTRLGRLCRRLLASIAPDDAGLGAVESSDEHTDNEPDDSEDAAEEGTEPDEDATDGARE